MSKVRPFYGPLFAFLTQARIMSVFVLFLLLFFTMRGNANGMIGERSIDVEVQNEYIL